MYGCQFAQLRFYLELNLFHAGNAPWLVPLMRIMFKNSKRGKGFKILYNTAVQLIQQRRAMPEGGKVNVNTLLSFFLWLLSILQIV